MKKLWACYAAATLLSTTSLWSEAKKTTPATMLPSYLQKQGQSSDQASCKQLYEKHGLGGQYTGTDEQCRRLLVKLLETDAEANAAASKLSGIATPKSSTSGSESVTHFEVLASYAFVENVGGTATFSVSVQATPQNGRIRDRNFHVVLNSLAQNHANFTAVGKVQVLVEGKETNTFKLSSAWFDTIGPSGSKSVHLYAEEGTTLDVTKGRKVEAVISITPFFDGLPGLSRSTTMRLSPMLPAAR